MLVILCLRQGKQARSRGCAGNFPLCSSPTTFLCWSSLGKKAKGAGASTPKHRERLFSSPFAPKGHWARGPSAPPFCNTTSTTNTTGGWLLGYLCTPRSRLCWCSFLSPGPIPGGALEKNRSLGVAKHRGGEGKMIVPRVPPALLFAQRALGVLEKKICSLSQCPFGAKGAATENSGRVTISRALSPEAL